MRIRTTAAAVLVAAAGTFVLSGVAHAGPDERDCEDFGSQRQAQAVLDSADGDPARLDADGDGRACEIWFANHGGSGSASADVDRSGGTAASTDADPEPDAGEGTSAEARTKAGDGSSAGPARQVSPVPRGGVDTGLDIAGPGRPNPAASPVLLIAAFAVAGTAAAGAAAAARRPARVPGAEQACVAVQAPVAVRTPAAEQVRVAEQAPVAGKARVAVRAAVAGPVSVAAQGPVAAPAPGGAGAATPVPGSPAPLRPPAPGRTARRRPGRIPVEAFPSDRVAA